MILIRALTNVRTAPLLSQWSIEPAGVFGTSGQVRIVPPDNLWSVEDCNARQPTSTQPTSHTLQMPLQKPFPSILHSQGLTTLSGNRKTGLMDIIEELQAQVGGQAQMIIDV